VQLPIIFEAVKGAMHLQLFVANSTPRRQMPLSHILQFHPSHDQIFPAPPMQKREECSPSWSTSCPYPHSHPTQHATSALSLLLLLYPCDVLPTNRIPARHVLLHAGAEATLFAAGDGRAGFGDAALEAMFVDFLNAVG
jgi:hypothetical protein